MTVQKGVDWGALVTTPGGPWASGGESDLSEHVNQGSSMPFQVTDGALYELLGHPASPVGSHMCRELPLDLISIEMTTSGGVDMTLRGFNVVIRRRLTRGGMLRGSVVVASSLGMYRILRLSNRAHPNDGRMEVLAIDRAPIRQRLLGFSRLRRGEDALSAHFRVSHESRFESEIPSGYVVLIDGRRVSAVRHVRLSVATDAVRIHIGIE